MGGDLMNKLKTILACMIITLGILYLPEIHANASTVTIDEATFPDSCVRKFAQEQDVNKDGVLSDEERNIVDYALWDWYTAAAYGVDGSHLIDFTGMQNFRKITKVRLQLGCKVNGKEIYWNYKASNLFQCFPHVKQLSIVSFGTKSIELSGESNTLEALDISFENEILKTGEVVCKMYAPNIKEIDITGNISTKSYSLTKLKKLYVGNCTTKCNINKCTKLEELGIINRGTTDLSLKSKSLKHLQYRGGKVKKLSVKKCPKLYAVTIRGTKAKSLDFKGNKNLLYLSIYNSNIGKVVYPKVKKADWRYEYKIQDKRFSSDPITNAEESGIFTYEHYLGGYNINQVKTVDISAWKRLSSAMKKRQLANGYKFVMKQYTPRRIIINKKLRSSDKKWIRAVAKKIKAKVIMW